MFTRQKIVLNLLDIANCEVSSLQLQKLMFLYSLTAGQQNRVYDFVPHKFGCYSFTLHQDQRKLEDMRLIKVRRPYGADYSFISLIKPKFVPIIKKETREKLQLLVRKFIGLSESELIAQVYEKKPYYAIRSDILSHFDKNKTLLEKIDLLQTKFGNEKHCLYTIGYEKKSLESFINELIVHNIKLVVDVRRNAYSMKPNFKGFELENILEKTDIDYVHIPEIGIASEDRKTFLPQGQREELFRLYYDSLTEKKNFVDKVIEYYQQGNIALMCFELNPKDCHRLQLAKFCKANYPDDEIEICNI